MAEKHIVAAIMRLLKKRSHCFAWKEHGGQYGRAGLPDIIVCYRGRFVAFEVKTETGKLTKLQETTLRRINAAKGHAYKVTSAAQVAAILNELEGNDDADHPNANDGT
ncbi:MAG TPA: VRR-NUC domain-containing protein [Candidatus Limiplasma sp.]|nr:VRR-NUC domain-containing protein [Candidatus Limiplasma sp.]